MRFRASIENVPTFLHLIQTVEKLAKTCIIKFSENEMKIICDKTGEGGVQVWTVIKPATLFKEYRIQSNSNNEISMRIGPEPLIQALRSASSSAEVILKLAKKNDHAVLSFDITAQTRQNKKVSVTQDVNIEVLKPTDVAQLKEPTCPDPDVHILLPPLAKLRTVTDHLRQLSDVMGISANAAGHLKLFIETDTVKVVTEWTNCKPAHPGNEDDEPRDPEAYASTLVSVKNFLKFLSSHVVSTNTMACICHKNCIIMYVYIGEMAEAGGILTYYIPGHLDGLDGIDD